MPSDGGPVIVICLQPQRDSVPRMVRVRRAIKYLFRSCNCRCLSVEELAVPPPTPPQERRTVAGAGSGSLGPGEG
jgi:hypothetical protein